jgi:hypothetical protein
MLYFKHQCLETQDLEFIISGFNSGVFLLFNVDFEDDWKKMSCCYTWEVSRWGIDILLQAHALHFDVVLYLLKSLLSETNNFVTSV